MHQYVYKGKTFYLEISESREGYGLFNISDDRGILKEVCLMNGRYHYYDLINECEGTTTEFEDLFEED